MAWRDAIAACAESADVEGVLRIFDELCADREKVWQLNNAYLSHIEELQGSGKKAPPKVAVDTERCLKLQLELGALLKKVKL